MKRRKNTKISDQLGILEKVGAIWPQLQAVRPRPGRPASRFGQMASGQSHTDTYIVLHAKMHSNVQHATVGSKRARTQGLRRFHLVLPLGLVTSSIQTPHHSTNERTTSGMAVERIESERIRGHPASWNTCQLPTAIQKWSGAFKEQVGASEGQTGSGPRPPGLQVRWLATAFDTDLPPINRHLLQWTRRGGEAKQALP